MEKYLIASGIIEKHVLPEAYLLKIEIIDNAPPFYALSSAHSSMFIKEKSFLKNSCGVVKCNLIKIKEIVYRASVGTRRKSNTFYDKQIEKELEEPNPFEIKSDRKLYYRKKLSSREYQVFLNRIWVMPIVEDKLLFEETSDKNAIERFKVLLPTVYIGPLNEQVDLINNYFYDNCDKSFITGRSNFIVNNTYFKPSDNGSWHFKNIEGYSSLYQPLEQDEYEYDDEINSTFWKKMNFILAMSNHNDLNTLDEIFKISNEYYPDLAGLYIESAVFFGLNQMYTPRPIFPFDCCFSNSGESKLHNLITRDIKEFLTNRNYFFMALNRESNIFKIPLEFISEKIIIKEMKNDPSEEISFKKFIKEEKEKK